MNPPRAAFVNYPLGHTAGRPNDLDDQVQIVRAALDLIDSATEPGLILPLPNVWPGEWRAKARELSDTRTERYDTPQYERLEDETAATQTAR